MVFKLTIDKEIKMVSIFSVFCTDVSQQYTAKLTPQVNNKNHL
jgi:hypothetical protein